MKFSKLACASVAVTAALALGACSDNSENTESSGSSAAGSSSAAYTPTQLPTAEELNAILVLAANPDAPIEQRVQTVQNGESAPELFEVMAKSKIESGADFQVVQPILPGYTPDSVLATVNFTLPDREAQPAENVEFINENGTWKLSQSWACTLITNTVPVEQVPAMCNAGDVVEAPVEQAPVEEAPAEQAPVEEVPAEQAPVEEAPVEEAPAQ